MILQIGSLLMFISIVILLIWGYTFLNQRFNKAYDNHEVLYLKMLETEIAAISIYLNILKVDFEQAVENEDFEKAKMISDTLKHNSRTLKELRKEAEMIAERKQSPR